MFSSKALPVLHPVVFHSRCCWWTRDGALPPIQECRLADSAGPTAGHALGEHTEQWRWVQRKKKLLSFSFNVKAVPLSHTHSLTHDGKEIKLACTQTLIDEYNESIHKFVHSLMHKHMHTHKSNQTRKYPILKFISTSKLQLTFSLKVANDKETVGHWHFTSIMSCPFCCPQQHSPTTLSPGGTLCLSSPKPFIPVQRRPNCPMMSDNLAVFFQWCLQFHIRYL